MGRTKSVALQDRLGPNLSIWIDSAFADIIKLLIKEDITPVVADKFYQPGTDLALATVVSI
jgi:NADH:ubiquinone oxidoreductase subunit H